jgi:hypothetical protein
MKQAVVLIHGIGEQMPMDTLRSFVGAVLGPGIRDVPVRTRALGGLAGLTILAHTHYWDAGDEAGAQAAQPGPAPALSALSSALALTFLRKFRAREVGSAEKDESGGT